MLDRYWNGETWMRRQLGDTPVIMEAIRAELMEAAIQWWNFGGVAQSHTNPGACDPATQASEAETPAGPEECRIYLHYLSSRQIF